MITVAMLPLLIIIIIPVIVILAPIQSVNRAVRAGRTTLVQTKHASVSNIDADASPLPNYDQRSAIALPQIHM